MVWLIVIPSVGRILCITNGCIFLPFRNPSSLQGPKFRSLFLCFSTWVVAKVDRYSWSLFEAVVPEFQRIDRVQPLLSRSLLQSFLFCACVIPSRSIKHLISSLRRSSQVRICNAKRTLDFDFDTPVCFLLANADQVFRDECCNIGSKVDDGSEYVAG